MKRWSTRIAGGARVVAAFAAVVVAGRFTFVSVDAALAERDRPTPSPPRPKIEASERPIIRADASTIVDPGQMLRVTMMVSIGPDQSDVFVDNAKVGQTPFIGDIQCRAKLDVAIRIVPTKGNTLDATRACKPGVIRVDSIP